MGGFVTRRLGFTNARVGFVGAVIGAMFLLAIHRLVKRSALLVALFRDEMELHPPAASP